MSRQHSAQNSTPRAKSAASGPAGSLCGLLASLSLMAFLGGCSNTSGAAAKMEATSVEASPAKVAAAAKPDTSRQANSGTPKAKTTVLTHTDLGLEVPPGFVVNVFADNLDVPRRLAVAPGASPGKYDVFVAESRANRIRVLKETNGDGKADGRFVYTANTAAPYGLAFHPQGWLYIGNTDAIVRFPYKVGATSTAAAPQVVSPLTEGGYNQHWTRNLLFSRDFKKLYVTVGSSCNTCEEDDSQRAAISVMNPDGSGRRLFATGLRNPVGLAWRPGTEELWTAVNERDNLGDDTPPDYLTLVRDGSFHGWPYAYSDINGTVVPDPSFGPGNEAKVQKTVPPSVPVQAHSAALGIAFYPLLQPVAKPLPGTKPFPAEFAGNAFSSFHGSWNRSERTGFKVVRVDFKDGKPGRVTDFVKGFLLDGGKVWGRPVDVIVAPDGSVLFSDDTGGKIWRVSYRGKK